MLTNQFSPNRADRTVVRFDGGEEGGQVQSTTSAHIVRAVATMVGKEREDASDSQR